MVMNFDPLQTKKRIMKFKAQTAPESMHLTQWRTHRHWIIKKELIGAQKIFCIHRQWNSCIVKYSLEYSKHARNMFVKKVGRYLEETTAKLHLLPTNLLHFSYAKMYINTHSLTQFVQNLIRKSYLKNSHDFFSIHCWNVCNAA